MREVVVEVRWITDAGVKVIGAADIREAAARRKGVLWVHVDHSEQDGLALLAEMIKPVPEDLKECHNRTPVPKLHSYPTHHFSAINGLARGTDGLLHFQPLKIFFNLHQLWTVFGPAHEALTPEAVHRDLDAIRSRVDAAELRPETAFELVATIRLEMLRSQEQLVTAGASRISELERNVMQRDPVTAEELLDDLFRLRHDLQTIRTNAAQTHELYVHLMEVLGSQPGVMQVDLRRLNDLKQGYSHLKNTTDLEREYLQEVLDLFQTRVSTELNRFVRKITAWGSIGIAWTVMAGIYGMNFVNMPELNWRYGYPMVLAAMATVGVVLILLFRRQRWL
jgi:magnesium/cobalt transport protein CorA